MENEGIFQAKICLLEIRRQLKRKSTFLLSHRHSSFHVFNELLFLTTRTPSAHFHQLKPALSYRPDLSPF